MARSAAIDRRCFLRWSALIGSGFASAMAFDSVASADGLLAARPQPGGPGPVTVVRTGCPGHNCGGRCLLKVHVQDGIIARIETDDRPADDLAAPQLRACARGRAYRARRLSTPDAQNLRRGSRTYETVTACRAAGCLGVADDVRGRRIRL